MKTTPRIALIAGIAGLWATQGQAVVITFTGGTVTRLDTSTVVTNNTVTYDDVDYYEEGGFRLDFTPNAGSGGFATHVGNYYGAGNDVIHSHWETGIFGDVTAVVISKIGGGTFDLNYFVLTSNTAVGGGLAIGTEMAWVEARDGTNTLIGSPVLLPKEDWGFPATQIFLGSDFDAATTVVFYVTSAVDCFGMDEFYIDEPAPPAVPDSGSTLGLLAAALGGIAGLQRRRTGGK